MPFLSASTSFAVRHGAQTTGSEDPNSTTTGIPKAAAMCAGPLSFPMKIDASFEERLGLFSGRFTRSDTR